MAPLNVIHYIVQSSRISKKIKASVYQSFWFTFTALSSELWPFRCSWVAEWMHIIYSLLSIANKFDQYFLKCHILHMLKFKLMAHMNMKRCTGTTYPVLYRHILIVSELQSMRIQFIYFVIFIVVEGMQISKAFWWRLHVLLFLCTDA